MAQQDDHTLVSTERLTVFGSLPPVGFDYPLEAMCATVLSPLLCSYYKPANGIVLAYKDVQLSTTPPTAHISRPGSRPTQEDDKDEPQHLLLRHIDEYTAPFLWVTASFLIWRPIHNAYLTGCITHQAQTHITLSYLNIFPVSVLAQHMPNDWRWHSEETGRMKKGWDGRVADEGGWWVNGEGEKVEERSVLRVRIRDFEGRMDGKDKGKSLMRIEGSLLSVEEEKARVEKRREKERGTLRSVREESEDMMEED